MNATQLSALFEYLSEWFQRLVKMFVQSSNWLKGFMEKLKPTTTQPTTQPEHHPLT